MNKINKNYVIRYVFWAITLGIMIFIFCNSAQTAEQSNATSGGFTENVLTAVFPEFSKLALEEKQIIIEDLQFFVRKAAHFSVYLALSLSCFFAINTYIIKMKYKVFSAFFISVVYAFTDEIHQLFVPGRSGEIRDVIIDSAGACVGVLIALAIVFTVRKIRYKRRRYCEKKGIV